MCLQHCALEVITLVAQLLQKRQVMQKVFCNERLTIGDLGKEKTLNLFVYDSL